MLKLIFIFNYNITVGERDLWCKKKWQSLNLIHGRPFSPNRNILSLIYFVFLKQNKKFYINICNSRHILKLHIHIWENHKNIWTKYTVNLIFPFRYYNLLKFFLFYCFPQSEWPNLFSMHISVWPRWLRNQQIDKNRRGL